jgi:hypothetical protein
MFQKQELEKDTVVIAKRKKGAEGEKTSEECFCFKTISRN